VKSAEPKRACKFDALAILSGFDFYEFFKNLPAPAVQKISYRLFLRFQPEPACALSAR